MYNIWGSVPIKLNQLNVWRNVDSEKNLNIKKQKYCYSEALTMEINGAIHKH